MWRILFVGALKGELVARRRGFFAELQHLNQQAEKRRRQQEAAASRAHAAAQREAERAGRAAERARAAAVRCQCARARSSGEGSGPSPRGVTDGRGCVPERGTGPVL